MLKQIYCYNCGRQPADEMRQAHIGYSGDAKLYAARPHCRECSKSESTWQMYLFIAVLIIGGILLAATLYDEYSYTSR